MNGTSVVQGASGAATGELGLDWREAASEAPGATLGAEAGLLSDAERSTLLGRDRLRGGRPARGVRALLAGGASRYARMPVLEALLERWSRALPASLRRVLPEPVEIRAEAIAARRFGDHLANLPRPAVIAIFRAVPWDRSGLLTVDHGLAYTVVDLLLGGRALRTSTPVHGRACTEIEAVLLERPIRAVLAELGAAFAPIARVEFVFERIETDPRFVTIARASDACVLCPLLVAAGGRGGRLELLLPRATLEPVREELAQEFPGEGFGHDPVWERHLARELRASEIELEAVLPERRVPLREILALEVGATLCLDVPAECPVILRCGDLPLFEGRLGRRGDRVSVKIERRLGREGEE